MLRSEDAVGLLATHGIAQDEVFVYAEKAPYTTAGFGDLGVLRYNETEDKVQCHECGKWFMFLGKHVCVNRLTARGYKRKYGLRLSTALASPKYVARLREKFQRAELLKQRFTAEGRRLGQRNGPLRMNSATVYASRVARPELQNKRMRCQAQIMADYYSLRVRLGRIPTQEEFLRFTGVEKSVIKIRFSGKTWSEFVRFAEDIPHASGEQSHYSRSALEELLRDFWVKFGRLPMTSHYKSRYLPPKEVFVHHFGSMGDAMDAAGLGLIYRKQRPQMVSVSG